MKTKHAGPRELHHGDIIVAPDTSEHVVQSVTFETVTGLWDGDDFKAVKDLWVVRTDTRPDGNAADHDARYQVVVSARGDIARWATEHGWTLTKHPSNTGDNAGRFTEWQRDDMVAVVHYDALQRVASAELYKIEARGRVQVQRLPSRLGAKQMKVLAWLE